MVLCLIVENIICALFWLLWQNELFLIVFYFTHYVRPRALQTFPSIVSESSSLAFQNTFQGKTETNHNSSRDSFWEEMLLFEREREEKVKRKGDKEMQISWPGGVAQPRLASQPKIWEIQISNVRAKENMKFGYFLTYSCVILLETQWVEDRKRVI